MREKLHIRLPEDDEHGPNPYDSKTMPIDLPTNAWLASWQWWITALVAGCFIAGSAWWRSQGG